MWESEKVPKDWTRSSLVKLFKRADAMKYEKWPGICLFSIPGKLFALIILNRIKPHLDIHLHTAATQLPSKPLLYLIFVLRILLEETNEVRRKLNLVFIDFEKAFDSVDRAILWKILAHYSIPERIIKLIIAS